MRLLAVSTINESTRSKKSKAFSFEKFGSLAGSEIEYAPLTVICGKNNTGKSYLAYLIWTYFNFESQIFGPRRGTLKAPPWFRDLASELDEVPVGQSVKVSAAKVQAHVNRWIGSRKNAIARRLLNLDKAKIGSFRLAMGQDVYLSRSSFTPDGFESDQFEFSKWAISFSEEVRPHSERRGWMAASLGEDHDELDPLYLEVIGHMLLGRSSVQGAAYVPASRSGLILSLRYIAETLFSRLAEPSEEIPTRFTAPMISFLRGLVSPSSSGNKDTRAIAEFLESNILHGRVQRSDDQNSSEFNYHPSNSKSAIPLHASSSMVTELTPILENLKSGFGETIILEEPEAHLHLSAQRAMARALVRACNKGIRVVVTTHSDTFIQQLNFLLMLERRRNKRALARALGYNKDEFLSETDLLAYEICARPGGNEIRKLDISEFGIAPSSLSDVVLEMNREILEVSE